MEAQHMQFRDNTKMRSLFLVTLHTHTREEYLCDSCLSRGYAFAG